MNNLYNSRKYLRVFFIAHLKIWSLALKQNHLLVELLGNLIGMNDNFVFFMFVVQKLLSYLLLHKNHSNFICYPSKITFYFISHKLHPTLVSFFVHIYHLILSKVKIKSKFHLNFLKSKWIMIFLLWSTYININRTIIQNLNKFLYNVLIL